MAHTTAATGQDGITAATFQENSTISSVQSALRPNLAHQPGPSVYRWAFGPQHGGPPESTGFWPGPSTARPANHRARAGPARMPCPGVGRHPVTLGGTARPVKWRPARQRPEKPPPRILSRNANLTPKSHIRRHPAPDTPVSASHNVDLLAPLSVSPPPDATRLHRPPARRTILLFAGTA
jgi:hypothetical protein